MENIQDELNSQVEILQEQNAEHVREIERLQHENFEHEGQIKSLARQVELFTGELDNKHSAKLKIESLKYDLERERNELLEEIGRLRDLNEDLQRVNDQTKNEVESLQRGKSQLESEIFTLRNEIQIVINEKEKHENLVVVVEIQKNELESEIRHLNEQIEKLDGRKPRRDGIFGGGDQRTKIRDCWIEKLEWQRDDNRDVMEFLEGEIRKQKYEIVGLERARNELADDVFRLEQENKIKEQRLKELEMEKEEMEIRIVNLRSEIEININEKNNILVEVELQKN
ncbi:uncharacterized protein [Palaemon carinicauda]|uniref:uncharacterized protein n=1 Tax=Palaemon carinicauda TaxID=392227 RepID=UPI0035B67033